MAAARAFSQRSAPVHQRILLPPGLSAGNPRRWRVLAKAHAAASRVVQQVNKDNFALMLPIMKDAIRESAWVAVDLEMTGLWARNRFPLAVDDAESRYAVMRSAAAQYLPVQLGISCFTWVPDQPSVNDSGLLPEPSSATASGGQSNPVGAVCGHWEARTFNLSLFPHIGPPVPGSPLALKGGSMVPSDAIFSCTAASIKFLVDQGFDLNTWVRHGVPYMPLATRDKAMHQVQNHLETTSGAEAAQLDETQQPQPQQQQQQQQKAARSKASAAAQELTSPSLHSQSGLRGSQQEVEALIEKLGQVERWLESAAAGYAALRPHQQQPQAQQWAMTSERGATQLQALIRCELQGRPDLPSFEIGDPVQVPAADFETNSGAADAAVKSKAGGASNSSSKSGAGGSSAGSGKRQKQSSSSSQQQPVNGSTQKNRDAPGWSISVTVKPPGTKAPSRGISVHRSGVQQAAGAALLAGILRTAGKPLVLHNGGLDLAYLVHHLVRGSLPSCWHDFKQVVARAFPGGVYDTKYLAREVLQPVSGHSVGGQMVGDSAGRPLQALYALLGASELSQALGHPLPSVRHAPGYEEYEAASVAAAALPQAQPPTGAADPAAAAALEEGTSSPAVAATAGEDLLPGGDSASSVMSTEEGGGGGVSGPGGSRLHEAGMDAFLTGACFAWLLAAASARPTAAADAGVEGKAPDAGGSPAGTPSQLSQPMPSSTSVATAVPAPTSQVSSTTAASTTTTTSSLLAPVTPFRGRLFMMRCDVAYAPLEGPDPLPDRPRTFHVTGIPQGVIPRQVVSRFIKAGLAPVQVYMLDPDVWALPTFGASSDQDSGDKPDCSSSSSSGASAKQQKPQKAGQARSGQQQQQQGGGNRQVSGTYSRQQEALVYFPDEGKAVQVMAKASSIDPQWKIVPYKTFAEARRARTKATKEDS